MINNRVKQLFYRIQKYYFLYKLTQTQQRINISSNFIHWFANYYGPKKPWFGETSGIQPTQLKSSRTFMNENELKKDLI